MMSGNITELSAKILSNPTNCKQKPNNISNTSLKLARTVASCTSFCEVSDSDSSETDACCFREEHNYCMNNSNNLSFTKRLPPIGVFWDIENCQVPKGRSAFSVAQLIRELFFTGYRETEFVVVCDVKKETSQVVQDLHDAQVTLIHVAATCKNAADERLRQALRRFADTYESPAAVILISGDINFAGDLSDLRYRKKLHVILVHNDNAADALILCATEHYNYKIITQTLPVKETKINPSNEAMEVTVHNLPKGFNPMKLRNSLKKLSSNCGGRVVYVSLETGTAVIRFNNLDVALRAKRRMEGEYVYGNKVSVNFPSTARCWNNGYSPYKLPAHRLSRNADVHMPMAVGGGSSSSLPYPTVDPNNASAIICQQPSQFQRSTGLNTTVPIQGSGSSSSSKSVRSIRGTHGTVPVHTTVTAFSSSMKHNNSNGNIKIHKQRKSIQSNKQLCPVKNISGSFTSLNTFDNEDTENQFLPIARSNSLSNGSNSSSQPIDLLVTNLDQTLNIRYLKKVLLNLFKEHAMVINLSLMHQSDGNLAATVRVSTIQDAQYVISQLQRRKLGHKRIVISYSQTSTPNPHLIRSQVIALLQDVPGNQMPLFKFRELLETRFRNSVSVSELYKLKNICNISDELGGRMISLMPELRADASSPQLNVQPGIETPYCILHCPNGLIDHGWAEPETTPLPNVRFQLKVFAAKIRELLQSHMGVMALLSLPVCYEMYMGEKMPTDDTGVPLEHLVTCVAGVELKLSKNLIKYLVFNDQTAKNESPNNDDGNSNSSVCGGGTFKCVSPPLVTQLALFSRELVDLLKTAPHCQLPFSRFIPAYHHHFGRQCRVADYGYTKLVDLLDSLSHIVQVIGEGNKRFITLSHNAQIRRFTSDLLRVLKTQVSKQVNLSEFGAAYERVLSRTFDPVDYGLCSIFDLLNEISENIVVIKNSSDGTVIAIPKREQTQEEMQRTKQFAIEVVDLLRHAPQYGILFNKFVPAYHHHFGNQCRVSDYGFTKLIELFEALPDIVKIEETSDCERKVSLLTKEALKVVREQITALIKSSKQLAIPLITLPAIFLREYGYPLRPELYDCFTIEEIIEKLADTLQLTLGQAGQRIITLEHSVHNHLQIHVWALLLKPPHILTVHNLLHQFHLRYGYTITVEEIQKYPSFFRINKCANDELEVTLTPRYTLAVRLYHLLYENNGTIYLGTVDGMYLKKYGTPLRTHDYDAKCLNALLSQFPFLFVVHGHRYKRNVSLCSNITALYGIPLPLNMKSHHIDGDDNVFHLPQPSVHNYLINSSRIALSPPKPDTPPTNQNSFWDNAMWPQTPTLNLCIPLPIVQTPILPENYTQLISPIENIIPGYLDTFMVRPPHPSELPMPSKEMLEKVREATPTKDSGNSSATSLPISTTITTTYEPDSSTNIDSENSTPTKKKRPNRLAANFMVPKN